MSTNPTDVCLVKNARPGKRVNLAEHEIVYLCQKSRQIFLSQPILLELEAPIKVCGKEQWPLRVR